MDLADRSSLVAGGGSARAAAFTRLADEHLDKAYRLARAILRDDTEAQDAAHDAFVLAWRKWDTLRDPARFEPWFDQILVNACRDRLRRRGRQATDISAEVALATGDHTGRTDDRTALGAAIATLSPDQQVVVALRYFRDLTIEDIAGRLDIPAGTVASRLHYALKRLHEALNAGDSERTQR
jgi:RNA polymerase sigma-70 factor (ECF subfamily)